jgi:prolyl-tRNA synthetase
MRFSSLLIPTLKETPKEAEVVSHQLMMRAGMIRRVAAGIYEYLPLGLRVIRNVERIVREELNRAGCQEVLLPAVIPAELWQESGRWSFYGKELLRLKDRHDREYCVGPTHEEVMTDLVRTNVSSYRELPINLYQIQTKFRDEVRPRFGLMRGREFIMKDGYSFDVDFEGLDKSYEAMYEAYSRIFKRLGLDFRAVEADTGAIGGSSSHEFMVLADSGEDAVVSCTECRYGANIEKAESHMAWHVPEPLSDALALVDTPNARTIEEVSAFLKVPQEAMIKTLVYDTNEGPLVVLVRGDQSVNEAKVRSKLGLDRLEMADDALVQKVTGAPVGFAGPVGLKARIVADVSVKSIADGVTGGNQADKHYLHVVYDRDYKVERFDDFRIVGAGEICPRCQKGPLRIDRGVEVGHIFKLGLKYSEKLGCNFLDKDGVSKPMVMGTYGIGIGRSAASAIEQHHDADGIKWPMSIAPFPVAILVLGTGAPAEKAKEVEQALLAAGIEALVDDREERPGVKFKDADLIGIPLRVTIGEKGLKEGIIELKDRHTGQVDKVPVEQAVEEIRRRVAEGMAS